MPEKTGAHDARRYGLMALVALLAERIVVSCMFVLKPRAMPFGAIPTTAIVGFVFSWVVPPPIAYRLEKRGLRSLGLFVPRESRARHALCAIVGLVLPAVVLGVNRVPLVDFVEQFVYNGVAEELFSRG